MTDFSKTLIRCSSLGAIMTEPVSKEAKLAGELSKSAKTELIKTYIREVYDREKDITTRAMTKGIENEEQGISMLATYLSANKNESFLKNKERYSNEWITGHPDVITETEIYDTKLSYDLWSFLPNVTEPLDKSYYYQIMGYMWLTGRKSGSIAYVLTDCPEHIINQEKRYLLNKMNVISEESPDYIEAAAGLEINLIYPDIPINEKVLIIPVAYDEEIIEKIKTKVVKCREFLQDFSEKHLNFNKKSLVLQ